jgi:hypothetical protein
MMSFLGVGFGRWRRYGNGVACVHVYVFQQRPLKCSRSSCFCLYLSGLLAYGISLLIMRLNHGNGVLCTLG